MRKVHRHWIPLQQLCRNYEGLLLSGAGGNTRIGRVEVDRVRVWIEMERAGVRRGGHIVERITQNPPCIRGHELG